MLGSILVEYFPNPMFAWVFYGALVLILAVAAYFDLKDLKIPKQLSLGCFGVGVAMNLVRGAWLAGEEDWLAGLGDGFFFSLGGFATGFGIFLVMWLMGLCGGGDVKIFAAVGAWIGFKFTFWLWCGSILTLIVVAGVRYFLYMATEGRSAARAAFSAKENADKPKDSLQSRRRLIAYSLPLAIATAVMLLWFFRFDLRLAQNPANVDSSKAEVSARL
ncbi:MAG TPA: prepilin peptidase [Gemmataceae bacterium]|nr:prepilin peptidase [Gemmataceae bacterium]